MSYVRGLEYAFEGPHLVFPCEPSAHAEHVHARFAPLTTVAD